MAITLVDHATGTAGYPPPPVAFNTPCSIGDVLICEFVGGAADQGVTTVSDNVNSGHYTLLNYQYDATTTTSNGIWLKIANAAGTPTVTITQTNPDYGSLYIARFNGFIGTPTVDASLAPNKFNNASSTTTVLCSPVTSNFNNELLLASFYANSAQTSATVANWTAVDGTTYGTLFYYAVVPANGTNNSFAATLLNPVPWQSIFAGIYDYAPPKNIYTLVAAGASSRQYNAAITPSLPAGYVAGNLLILQSQAGIAAYSAPAVAGWTLLASNASLGVWGLIATGTAADAPSVNWGTINADASAWIIAYSGNPVTLGAITANTPGGIIHAVSAYPTPANNVSNIDYEGLTITSPGCLVLLCGARNNTSATQPPVVFNSILNSGSFIIDQTYYGNTYSSDFNAITNRQIQTVATSIVTGGSGLGAYQTMTANESAGLPFTSISIALLPAQNSAIIAWVT